MSIFWLAPAAIFGLLLVAVPIAIHLLVRQQSRRVDYPSLRFVQPSALAAFRRRSIQDALLLACRAAIVVAAVLALAGPVWRTTSRTIGQADRIARAVVVVPGAAIEIGERAQAGSFVSGPSRGRISSMRSRVPSDGSMSNRQPAAKSCSPARCAETA